MSSLNVQFLDKTLPTPFVLASGIWGTTVSLLMRAADSGFGAVTAKSCGPTPRPGHVNPSTLDWGHGLINAIGLANPGITEELALLNEAKSQLASRDVPVPLIASIFGGTVAEFGEVAAQLTQIEQKPDFVEVNISCPNVASDFGEPFCGNPDSTADVTAIVKEALAGHDIPIIVKLGPNVPSIARIAVAAVEAGADALCAINTMPGMIIDPMSGQPTLANNSGGLSGPSLKPIALKCVYDIRRACPEIPIIGTGGVTTGDDAVEMIMAGATAIGIGSVLYHRGLDALESIEKELRERLYELQLTDISEARNMAHNPPTFATPPSVPPVPTAH